MSIQLYLLGTSHAYQFGAGITFGETHCSHSDEERFRSLLKSLVALYGLNGILEEMSLDALAEQKLANSVPKLVADELGTVHAYCEPRIDDRRALGILAENEIRTDMWMNGSETPSLEERIAESFKLRERFWVDRILEVGASPILYVCGANHVASFPAVAGAAGIEVQLIAADWQ